MIKIELKDGAVCKTMDELSKAYFDLMKIKTQKKVNSILKIYQYCRNGKSFDPKNIHGKSIPKILSILTDGEIKSAGEHLTADDLKINFINKFRNNLCGDFTSKKVTADFPELLNFLNEETTFDGYTFEQLVTSTPGTLEDISKTLKERFSTILNKNGVLKLLEYILDYSSIHTDKLLRKLFSDNLAVIVCPYCNRNYVSYIEHRGTKIIGPTLDHFLAKSIHPLLAASFYNLVPSCYVCNSNLKGRNTTTLLDHLNPFEFGFEEIAKFKLTGSRDNYGAALHIDYALPNANKIRHEDDENKGNAALFKIDEIYSLGHHYDICLIVDNCDKVDKYYESNLSNIFKEHSSIDEFYKFHFSNYFHNREFTIKPLSKLTNDLVLERLPWLL